MVDACEFVSLSLESECPGTATLFGDRIVLNGLMTYAAEPNSV